MAHKWYAGISVAQRMNQFHSKYERTTRDEFGDHKQWETEQRNSPPEGIRCLSQNEDCSRLQHKANYKRYEYAVKQLNFLIYSTLHSWLEIQLKFMNKSIISGYQIQIEKKISIITAHWSGSSELIYVGISYRRYMYVFCFIWFYLQVQWIEEQYDVFAFVLVQADLFEFAIDDSGAGKLRCWFIQSWHFVDFPIGEGRGEKRKKKKYDWSDSGKCYLEHDNIRPIGKI